MSLVNFTTALGAADSLFDLARLLGARCLDEGEELGAMKEQEASRRQLEAIAARVRPIAPGDWIKLIADPTQLEAVAGGELSAALEVAQMRLPLDSLGVLVGLVEGPLDEIFRTFTGKLPLDRGMPLPDATRRVPEGVEWMTLPATQNAGGPLGPLPWTLFGFSRTEGMSVVLDFSRREKIDDLTWSGAERLPAIATIHPHLGELDHQITRPRRFFDVAPLDPDPEFLLDRLAWVVDADIGLLPELCLARPDELEAELSGHADRYPRLVVAGSAHIRDGSGAGETRANESRIYLDGEHIATSRKHFPFRTKVLGGETYADWVYEDLTTESKSLEILASTHTRLAVVICADMIDVRVADRLVAAGVNLLLVPAMTPKAGSFETTVEAISGRRQGVSAVANVRFAPDGMPFLSMFGTPRAERDQRVGSFTGNGVEPPPEVAFFDSDGALPGAVKWR